jgi:hypothetical protein
VLYSYFRYHLLHRYLAEIVIAQVLLEVLEVLEVAEVAELADFSTLMLQQPQPQQQKEQHLGHSRYVSRSFVIFVAVFLPLCLKFASRLRVSSAVTSIASVMSMSCCLKSNLWMVEAVPLSLRNWVRTSGSVCAP